MKIETKYDVNDKVWLRTKNIESYIKEHPYTEPRNILKACFQEGYVNSIKVETDIFNKELIISYIITDEPFNEKDDPEEKMLQTYGSRQYHGEEKIFSNFDEVTNMIKESHKNVLNGLKYIADKILKGYE